MGALPILEIDDVMICQSNAISRYVARKFGEFTRFQIKLNTALSPAAAEFSVA